MSQPVVKNQFDPGKRQRNTVSREPCSEPDMRPLLIADDFALTQEIDTAIMTLATAGNLSGTSVLVAFAKARSHVPSVQTLREVIAVGIHLNLTEGPALTALPQLTRDGQFTGLRTVIMQAVTRRLDIDAVTREFTAQIVRFRSLFGVLPDMVDGHQHVHALPAVRQATFAAIDQTFGREMPAARPLVRDPGAFPAGVSAQGRARFKALTIAAFTRGFGRDARDRGMLTNSSFAGIADLNRVDAVGAEFAQALQVPVHGKTRTGGHLVMCHPATGGSDAIAHRRCAEFDALMRNPNLADAIAHPQRDGDHAIAAWPGFGYA